MSLKIMQKVLILPEADGNDIVKTLVTTATAIDRKKSYALSVLRTRWDRVKFASPSGSLKVMTQQCILKNKEYFCKLAQLQPDRHPFANISNAMEKELIELEAKNHQDDTNNIRESKEEVILQCQVLQLLINTKITTFHFPAGLSSDTQEAATALWKTLVAEKPPDLHTIIVRMKCRGVDIAPWNVHPFFFGMLESFPNLQVLRLANFACNNSHLRRIAHHLPKLRVLEFNLGRKVSRKGFKALTKLRLLEDFIFVDTIKEEQEHLLQDCFKLLPHLHAISGRSQPMSCMHEVELGYLIASTLFFIEKPLTLQLRRLEIDTEEFHFPEDVALPELQVLVLIRSGEVPLQLKAGRYPKLTELSVYVYSQDELVHLVGQVGRQLKTLRIFVNNSYELDAVLDVCPNLSELDMHVRDLRYSSALRPDTLHRLQVLHFSVDDVETIQPGLLLQFMRLAPKLRFLVVATVRLGVDEVKELTLLAKQRKCLRKLEKIVLKLRIDKSTAIVGCLADQAYLALSMNCPRLTHANISYDFQF